MKKTILFLCMGLAMAACSKKSADADKTNETEGNKTLVLYYSQTHATQQVAELISQKLGADLDSIVAEVAYDGDFQQTIARCQQEMAAGEAPAVKPLSHNVADYDTIYLGYPVWFGTYAQPVAGLLKSVDLSGKVIVPFCTFGSGGLNTSSNNLKAALPGATILEGYGIRNARLSAAETEVETFLIRTGKLAGTVEELPAFGEQQPVTDTQRSVFYAACGSYPMPLGTPVTVATRELSDGMEFAFVTESTNDAGETTNATIYVVASNAMGQMPEFIQAVR